MQETVFQREALEQQLRLAHARAIREASEPLPAPDPSAVDHFRQLLARKDPEAKALISELHRLHADPSHPHSPALARFVLECGAGLNGVEQNILLSTAGQRVDRRPLERRRRRILRRIFRHTEAAGRLGRTKPLI